MFKNLSMWLFERSPDTEQSINDTEYLRVALHDWEVAASHIVSHPPTNPGPGQLKKSGLLPVDDLVLEGALDGGNRFMPLTQVIRERVVDSGAVKFEVNERIKSIFAIDGRRVGRKEQIDITCEVIESMLKDAPIREKRVFGIVTSMGKILVGATGKAAEDYISYIKSLFGAGHIHVRPAELGTWNPTTGLDADQEDFIYLGHFARQLISEGVNEQSKLEFSGSFCFESAKEKFTVEHGQFPTIDSLEDRIACSYMKWISLTHEHAVFKLTSDLTLKSIKLVDIEYQPEDDQEAGLTSAYYRFYMSFFLGLFDTVVREVVKAQEVGDGQN